MALQQISVVLPMFNEEATVAELTAEVERQLDLPIEFVFVDDGSTDRTLERIKAYKTIKDSNRKKIVILSRNFGHQKAVMAGLFSVSKKSDCVLLMDADFQDNPKDIHSLIARLEDGYDCVYAARTANSGNFVVNILTRIFYKLQKAMLPFDIPMNAGVFSVFTREFLNNLLAFEESDIYFPGLRAYVGMRQIGVAVKRSKRVHGRSHVGFLGLINVAICGLLGFSAVPMRFIFLLGILTTLLCMFLGFVILLMKLVGITQVLGVTTILIFMLGLFGIQIMFIGIVGEYVGKLFLESKKRPRWLIREIIDER